MYCNPSLATFHLFDHVAYASQPDAYPTNAAITDQRKEPALAQPQSGPPLTGKSYPVGKLISANLCGTLGTGRTPL
jgi:hypothetical protein